MHRDLKSENILLDAELHPKIGDFGWSTHYGTLETLECGSPAYFAPEMVSGEGYDYRVDVWALGILLYEMLVGYSPFSSALTEKKTKERILKMDFGYGAWCNVPGAVQPLIQGLLRRDPAERLATRDALDHPWVVAHVGKSFHESALRLEAEQQPHG